MMSAEKRSAVMSRIRGRGTKPERAVEQMLLSLGGRFDLHARDLPGRPDFVVRDARVAILVDGDFWHRLETESWRTAPPREVGNSKIAANISTETPATDAPCGRRVGSLSELWEHQVEGLSRPVQSEDQAKHRPGLAPCRRMPCSSQPPAEVLVDLRIDDPRHRSVLWRRCVAAGAHNAAGVRLAEAVDAWGIATSTYADNFPTARRNVLT